MSGWVAGAAVAGSVISGVMSSDASRRASDTQAAAATQASNNQLQATQAANQMQWAMMQQNMVNQSPYMQGGQMGMAALQGAMFGAPAQQNYPGPQTGTPQGGGPTMTYGGNPPTMTAQGIGGAPSQVANGGQQLQAGPTATTQQVQPVGAPVGAPGLTAGSVPGAGSAPGTFTSATGQTVDASGNPVDTSGYGKVQNYGASQGQLNQAAGAFSGQLGKQFSNTDLNSQMAPNYQFQLNQGLQAMKANMAATGQLDTPQAMRALNNYAQNQASGAYQQAFSNWNTQQNNLYDRLQGMITPGSAAASAAGGAATSAGSGIAQTGMYGASAANNYMTTAAAANAAGTMGSNNALTGAIGSGLTGGINAYNKYNQDQQQAINAANPYGSPGYGSGLAYPAPEGYAKYSQPGVQAPAGFEP